MVVGIYVSLEPPNSMSVGLCIANAILPKEQWLARMGLSTSWPCWGVMQRIHADNGREFRGNMLQRNSRSEEHTSELQSHLNLVCRLLLEKKKPHALQLF